jgi:HlyD family secretion protein
MRLRRRQLRRDAVEIGRQTPHHAQVLGGLNEGDAVLLYPGERIADGVRVEPRGRR